MPKKNWYDDDVPIIVKGSNGFVHTCDECQKGDLEGHTSTMIQRLAEQDKNARYGTYRVFEGEEILLNTTFWNREKGMPEIECPHIEVWARELGVDMDNGQLVVRTADPSDNPRLGE